MFEQFAHHFINKDTLKSLDQYLQDVDEETLMGLIQAVVKPVWVKVLDNKNRIFKVSALAVSGWFLYRQLAVIVQDIIRHRRWLRKSYLSCVAAQLLTTEINQPFKKSKKWVDKRMLFQRELKSISILSDTYTQLMMIKAAERTTPENPFVTANLSEGDSWRVLNSLSNELSAMAGLSHMCALNDEEHVCRSDWYIIALMNPQYHNDVMRQFMGGLEIHCSDSAKSQCKLRLVLVWERELWEIVCRRIRPDVMGFETERHERRWALIQDMAGQYKRYMGKAILKAAHRKVLKKRRAVSGFSQESDDWTRRTSGGDLNSRVSGLLDGFKNLMSQTNANVEDMEVTQEQFLEEALEREIPVRSAENIFEEFDLNGDGSVSMLEIDERSGKQWLGKVDAHLYRVSLPIRTADSFSVAFNSFGEKVSRKHTEGGYDIKTVRSMCD